MRHLCVLRFGMAAFGATLITAAIPAAASAADIKALAAVPDLSGTWQMAHGRRFRPPASGPGPIQDHPDHPFHDRGIDAQGREVNPTPLVGDWRNPILKPWAADAIRKTGEEDLGGHVPETAESSCWPAGVPDILNFGGPVYFLQQPDVITVLYQNGPNVRKIYMDHGHSANLTPSWYGESIGHYEDGTLVVDTIGFNGKTKIDRYGTPHTEALHVVEHYRPIDDRTMQVDFTIEDPGAFTTVWSASMTYRRGAPSYLQESICAESTVNPVTGQLFPIPVSEKPDF